MCFSLNRRKGLLQLLGQFWEEELVFQNRSPSLFFSTLYSLFTQESLHTSCLVSFSCGERGLVAAMVAAVSGEEEESPFLSPCIYSLYKYARVFRH